MYSTSIVYYKYSISKEMIVIMIMAQIIIWIVVASKLATTNPIVSSGCVRFASWPLLWIPMVASKLASNPILPFLKQGAGEKVQILC